MKMTICKTKIIVEHSDQVNEEFERLGIEPKKPKLKKYDFAFILETVTICRESSTNEGAPDGYTYIYIDDKIFCIDMLFDDFYSMWIKAMMNIDVD